MSDRPILHVFVVGFHHKKGCLVEYCYPALTCDHNQETGLPDVWRTLPSLALPDGAHNYDRDTIFFHLPDPEDGSTVFGVSCYRQIAADSLKSKTSDITRTTVQKSVVVVSRLPLYGLIAVKCEMITHAYFSELDFSKVDCLRELYDSLNAAVTSPETLHDASIYFLMLSPRPLIASFHHKILVLFKLLLLEKKVS